MAEEEDGQRKVVRVSKMVMGASRVYGHLLCCCCCCHTTLVSPSRVSDGSQPQPWSGPRPDPELRAEFLN